MSQPASDANVAKQYDIKRSDLPLCCPMHHMTLWNSHPRVYLPIEEVKKIACPYCGTRYTLTE